MKSSKEMKEFKTRRLVDYFTGKNRVDVTDKNYESAIKLDNMIKIFNNNEIDILNKYYQMTKLFKTSSQFIKEYDYLNDFKDQSTVCYLYSYIDQISLYLMKIENGLSKETKKELLEFEQNNYFADYPYARYFVEQYINYKESPFLNDFLNYAGILEFDFQRFVCIVSELDDELFKKYNDKLKSNRLIRKSETIRKVNNIKDGILTGYTKDGTKFDNVEFYANLPYEDGIQSNEIYDDFNIRKMSTFDRKLKGLLDCLFPELANQIMKNIYDSKLISSTSSRISEKYINDTTFIINGQPLSSEAKKLIIKYMNERKIPFLNKAFIAVRDKYLNEGLEFKKEKIYRR